MNSKELKESIEEANVAIENAKSAKKELFYEEERKVMKKIKQITGTVGCLFIGNSLYVVKNGHIYTALVHELTNQVNWAPIYNPEYDDDPYCDAEGWDLDGGFRILVFLKDYLKDKFSLYSRFINDKNVGMIFYFEKEEKKA